MSRAIFFRYLNLAAFEKSKYGCKVDNTLFKTANPKVFRRIFCFALSQLSDFSEMVSELWLASDYSMGKKGVVLFSSKYKDIMSSINTYCPDICTVKPVSQSHLIAPQGEKIIEFFVSLFQAVWLIKFRQSGFLNLSSNSEIEIADSDDLDGCLEDLDELIKNAETELAYCYENEELLRARAKELQARVKNSPFASDEIKAKSEAGVTEDIFNDWMKELSADFDKAYESVAILESVRDQVNTIDSCIDSLINYGSTHHSLNGLDILNSLGFKSNISAKINSKEIIEDGQLNLMSFFDVVFSSSEAIVQRITPQGIESLNQLIHLKEGENKVKTDYLAYLQEGEHTILSLDEEYCQLIEKYKKERFQIIFNSEDSLDMEIKECYEKVNALEANVKGKRTSSDFCENLFPVKEEDLAMWVIGDNTMHTKTVHSSVKKTGNKSFKLLSRSYRKLHGTSNYKTECKNTHNPFFSKTARLLGLGADRRATLASPSARRERFRMSKQDGERLPLEPTTSRNLFLTSSPINQSGSKQLFFDKGVDEETSFPSPPFKSIEDTLVGDSTKFRLNRSMSEPNLNITQELLKWDNSSDNELDSPAEAFSPLVPLPNATSENSLIGSGTSSQLDESIKSLIAEYYKLREGINLSN